MKFLGTSVLVHQTNKKKNLTALGIVQRGRFFLRDPMGRVQALKPKPVVIAGFSTQSFRVKGD